MRLIENEFSLNERNRKMYKCDKDIFCKGKKILNLGTKKLNKKLKSNMK